MVVLSTFVVTIGLIEDNVTVVVGAMVIAPLLGPNIAFAFAASLGDTRLMGKALRSALAGFGVALAIACLIGPIWPVNLESREVLARTDVGLDSVVLALVSGAAAVLSLTTGVSTALVGVMVAVVLLPPTAALGMLLGGGQVGRHSPRATSTVWWRGSGAPTEGSAPYRGSRFASAVPVSEDSGGSGLGHRLVRSQSGQ